MPRWSLAYLRGVEALNYRIGRFAMYLLYVMMGILIWSSLTKFMHVPAIWTLEMAQFTLVAYYMLGAPYTFQLGTNVRMDLIYSRFSPRGQAIWDIFTVFCLMFYLGVMLWGAFDATSYAVAMKEVNPTAWRPPLWPIKAIITLSFALMLLQASAHLIRDIALIRGERV